MNPCDISDRARRWGDPGDDHQFPKQWLEAGSSWRTHPFVRKQTCFNMQGMTSNILCGERDIRQDFTLQSNT